MRAATTCSKRLPELRRAACMAIRSATNLAGRCASRCGMTFNSATLAAGPVRRPHFLCVSAGIEDAAKALDSAAHFFGGRAREAEDESLFRRTAGVRRRKRPQPQLLASGIHGALHVAHLVVQEQR